MVESVKPEKNLTACTRWWMAVTAALLASAAGSIFVILSIWSTITIGRDERWSEGAVECHQPNAAVALEHLLSELQSTRELALQLVGGAVGAAVGPPAPAV